MQRCRDAERQIGRQEGRRCGTVGCFGIGSDLIWQKWDPLSFLLVLDAETDKITTLSIAPIAPTVPTATSLVPTTDVLGGVREWSGVELYARISITRERKCELPFE
jgi:hypothetical protein